MNPIMLVINPAKIPKKTNNTKRTPNPAMKYSKLERFAEISLFAGMERFMVVITPWNLQPRRDFLPTPAVFNFSGTVVKDLSTKT